MAGVNLWIGVGNIGRDAEVRSTRQGQTVATFRIACTETWYDNNRQKKERTEWITCVMWGKRAEALKSYLVKGKQVYVEGKLTMREWTDRNEQKRISPEIRVEEIQLLGGGNGERRERAQRDEEPEGGYDSGDMGEGEDWGDE